MKLKINSDSNKIFGYFFSGIFFLLGIYFFFISNLIISYLCIVLCSLLFTISILRSEILSPFNMIWMLFGSSLGKIVSPIILAFLYFVLITPYSLIMKI